MPGFNGLGEDIMQSEKVSCIRYQGYLKTEVFNAVKSYSKRNNVRLERVLN